MVEKRTLLTTGQLAEYLQKPERTLRQWRYLKVGPRWVKLAGGSVRYRPADVENWLDEQARAAA